MSNDLRQAALAAALQIAKPTQSSLDVILVAQAFLGFLSTDTKVETAPAKPAKAAPVKAAKPAPVGPSAGVAMATSLASLLTPDPEPEAAEPTGNTVTGAYYVQAGSTLAATVVGAAAFAYNAPYPYF